jgi:hypothetical protein
MVLSRNAEVRAAGFKRLRRFVLPAILALAVPMLSAQQGSFVGQWRGTVNGITLTLVIQANGQYTQTAQAAAGMTEQSGPWKLAAPNTIIFSVTSWAPKTQQVYHATSPTTGYYATQIVAKPPGATDSYVFNGPNTVVLTDQIYHGSITMTRVQ